MTTDQPNLAQLNNSLAEPRARALAAGLFILGWEIRALDIDAPRMKVTLVLSRHDGRWLHVTGDEHGAVVERWSRQTNTGCTCERRPIPTSVINDAFLGRTRCIGIRSALRTACDYLVDNPAPGHGALPSADVRRLFAPLLTTKGPTST